MRILMVLDHEFPADIRVEKEIQTLISAGHSVDISCYTQKKRKQVEQADGFKILRRPISNFTLKTLVGALRFPFYFNFWYSFLEHLIKNGTYNAIHIHDLPLAKIGYDLSKKYQLKFVLDLHENWPVLMELSPHTKTFLGKILHNNKQWLKYEKKYSSLADGLIVVADEMKNRLLSHGIINKNIFTVPNTTDIDVYENLRNSAPNPDYFTLFYSGGINKHRGLEVVITGLSKITLKSNFRFWIAGKGKNESQLKQLVNNLNLNSHVVFLGWKTQKEVYELTLQSDVAVIPHLKNEHSDNTSPNKIFHYMLAKKPIIASDCNYIQNIIEQEDCGLIYNHESSEDFLEKLTIVMNDPSKRKYWGENGLNAVVKKYNWENTSEALTNLYKKLS